MTYQNKAELVDALNCARMDLPAGSKVIKEAIRIIVQCCPEIFPAYVTEAIDLNDANDLEEFAGKVCAYDTVCGFYAGYRADDLDEFVTKYDDIYFYTPDFFQYYSDDLEAGLGEYVATEFGYIPFDQQRDPNNILVKYFNFKEFGKDLLDDDYVIVYAAPRTDDEEPEIIGVTERYSF